MVTEIESCETSSLWKELEIFDRFVVFQADLFIT